MNIFQALKYEKQITMYSICNSFSVMATASMGGDKTALDAYFDARPNGDRAKLKYSAARVSGDKTKRQHILHDDY